VGTAMQLLGRRQRAPLLGGCVGLIVCSVSGATWLDACGAAPPACLTGSALAQFVGSSSGEWRGGEKGEHNVRGVSTTKRITRGGDKRMQTQTKTDRRYSEDVKPQPQRFRVQTGMVTCQSTAMAKKNHSYIYAIVPCRRCPRPRPAGRPRTAYPTCVMPHAMRCCAEEGRNKDIPSTPHQQPSLRTY